MSEGEPGPLDRETLPRAALHLRRRLSPIWAIPFVAVLIAAWLAYTTISARGPSITISFRTGVGIEAGKTRVKHNDVELGVVDRVELTPDLSHVIVTASMNKTAAAHLNAGTRFWVVRPRVSLSNLSGLETLLSGAYIEMDPGEGEQARDFVGLEDPPVVRSDVPGTEFILNAERLGSLGPASPVYFHGVKVGEVLGSEFDYNQGKLKIHAFVNKPYDQLVHPATRFWNDSGITVNAGVSGVKVEMESLQALLTGGVGFDTLPGGGDTTNVATAQTQFPLYNDRTAAFEATYEQRVPFIVEFNDSVHGLEVGAPVEFRGIRVGNVTDIRLQYDASQSRVRIPVTLAFEPQRVERTGLGVAQESSVENVMRAMNAFVQRGLRAQLQSASLISGQQIVVFDFFPEAPPAQIRFEGKIPVLPTVPSGTSNIAASANTVLTQVSGILDRVGKMPLEGVMSDTRNTLQAMQRLAEEPQIRSVLGSADKTLTSADKTLTQASETLTQLDALLSSANAGYGNGSEVRRGLVDLLRQLQDTARSMKALADALEQHPESVIRGKGELP
ncbi:MAG TPA: MlaD family protein [Stellaceae bacterium]|nr:MlaD family protein [Stellaceae bacterium]